MYLTRISRPLLGVIVLLLTAQRGIPQRVATDLPNRSPIESNLPIEAVGPDDLLALSVADCAELSKTFRVSKDGKLILPLLKQPVPVGGLPPTAIAAAVSEELIKEQILVQPVVSVQVLEYRSHLVTVAGAVKRPGQVQVAGHMTLLDVLSAAEGISPEAGAVVIVTTPAPASARRTTGAWPVPAAKVRAIRASAPMPVDRDPSSGPGERRRLATARPSRTRSSRPSPTDVGSGALTTHPSWCWS